MSPTPSRRALILGASLAPLAAAAPASAADPDAVLLELGRKWDAAKAAAADALAECNAADARAEALLPSMPDALKVRADDWHWAFRAGRPGRCFERAEVEAWRKGLQLDAPWVGASPRYYTRGREVVGAWDAHAQACKAVGIAAGVDTAQAALDRAEEAVWTVEKAAVATPATTLAGLRVKARIALSVIGEPDGTYEDHATRNVLADLIGEAPATV